MPPNIPMPTITAENHWRGRGNPPGGPGGSLWQTACSHPVAGKAGSSLAAFVALIEAMRIATQGLALPEAVDHVVHASGLLAHYAAEKDGQERVDNLQELINAADGFLRETEREIGEGGDDPLMSFLSHAALEAGETQAAEGRPALQLMTVHSAKGLEFHTVFVTGLEEGLFPHENSLSEYDGIEEEHRERKEDEGLPRRGSEHASHGHCAEGRS